MLRAIKLPSLLSRLSFASKLVNHLLPAPCLLCGQTNPDYPLLCPECDKALPRQSLQPFLCGCCALPLTSDAPLCGKCVQKPPAFSRAYIPFTYDYPFDFLVQQFKYRRQLSSGKLLARLLADHCKPADTNDQQPDHLVPVPMHWRKRWQRGFNQSELLAYWVGKQLGIPVLAAAAQNRYQHSQKGLGRQARLRNQRHLFHIASAAKRHLAGKHIALVDDVVTTTATARALSELLLKAGARQVDIWALARTPDR